MENLSYWIRALRRRSCLTQKQFADRLGVTYVTVSRWENEKVRPNRLGLICLSRLAESTNVQKPGNTFRNPPGNKNWNHKNRAALPVSTDHLTEGIGTPQSRDLNDLIVSPFSRRDKVAAVLKKSAVFSGLNKSQLVELSRLCTERRIKSGQFLYFESDVVDQLFLVAEGRVKVMKHSPSGKDFIVAFTAPGAMLGNIGLLTGKPHPTSAQAVIDTTVLAIGKDEFLSFVSEHLEIGSKILEKMLHVVGMRHMYATRRLADLAAEKVDRRLIETLLTLSLEFGPTLHFTREEMAQMSGTTTETAIRFFKRLRQEGIVSSLHQKLVILDHEKLRLLIEKVPQA